MGWWADQSVRSLPSAHLCARLPVRSPLPLRARESRPLLLFPKGEFASQRRPQQQRTADHATSASDRERGSDSIRIDMDGGEHEAEESSYKRRERLLALRSAANASPAGAPPPTAAGSILPDPDLPGDETASVCPTPPQRFDYYTNPAAAFTSSSGGATNPTWSHKRKSPPACYAPPPPPPAYGPYYPTSTY
jgi:hypothetical protein